MPLFRSPVLDPFLARIPAITEEDSPNILEKKSKTELVKLNLVILKGKSAPDLS